jgi:hypothetical protein
MAAKRPDLELLAFLDALANLLAAAIIEGDRAEAEKERQNPIRVTPVHHPEAIR